MEIRAINVCKRALWQQNFGAMKIDRQFNKVIKKAKAEVFDFDFLSPQIWEHTESFIRRLKNTFPNGEMRFAKTHGGLEPILSPTRTFPKDKSLMPAGIIKLKTILMQNGTCHGRDIRTLTFEVEELAKNLKPTVKL